MDDTSLAMTEKLNELIRNKTPAERAQMGSSMYDTSRALIERHILINNPLISKKELKKELFLKFYGDDFSTEELDRILKHLENK